MLVITDGVHVISNSPSSLHAWANKRGVSVRHFHGKLKGHPHYDAKGKGDACDYETNSREIVRVRSYPRFVGRQWKVSECEPSEVSGFKGLPEDHLNMFWYKCEPRVVADEEEFYVGYSLIGDTYVTADGWCHKSDTRDNSAKAAIRRLIVNGD